MKFLANNSTTYNYLYYATRPKWLIVSSTKPALLKQLPYHKNKLDNSLKQKANPLNSGHTCDSFKNKANGFLNLWSLCQQSQLRLKKSLSTKKNVLPMVTATLAAGRLFQTKELLCWTSDLSFFNLRGYFLSILKALQICRVAGRNNKKVLFIKGALASYVHYMRLNPWLQGRRQTLPKTLYSILNASYLNVFGPSFFNDCLENSQYLLGQINRSINSHCKKGQICKQKRAGLVGGLAGPFGQTQKRRAFCQTLVSLPIKSDKRLCALAGAPQSKANWKCFYQLNDLLNSHFMKVSNFYSIEVGQQDRFVVPGHGLRPVGPFLLISNVYKHTHKHLGKGHFTSYKTRNKKRPLLMRASNVIKLRIKEAQTMSQQIAGTQFSNSLAGFLTNSKTTFNTAYSLYNYNFYYSINIGTSEILNKKSSFWNPHKTTAQRLEKKLQESWDPDTQLKVVRSPKKNGPATVFRREKINSFHSFNIKDSRLLEFLNKLPHINKQWSEHSYNHYYLSVASSIYTKITLHSNRYPTKIKTQKLVEYGALGDIAAWRPKSMSVLSVFNSNSDSTKTKISKIKPVEGIQKVINLHTSEGFFRTNQIVGLKQKKSKKQSKATIAQFIMFSPLKAYRFLKRVKKKIKKEDNNIINLFKNNEKKKAFATQAPFSKKLPKKKKINTLLNNNQERCAYKTTYKQNNPSVVDISNYWYNTVEKKALLNKKIIKKEYLHGPSEKGWKRENMFKRSEGRFQNEIKIRLKKRSIKTTVCLAASSFCKYYKGIISLNYIKQYKMFAKTPFTNNQLGDILFFLNPEKTYEVVKQANSLKIPTIGVVSGITRNSTGRQSYDSSRLRESVSYPILGNPASYFFIRIIIRLFIKGFQTDNYKIEKQNNGRA